MGFITKCARCDKTTDLAFWDFYMTDEGYMCEDCEPTWAEQFMKNLNNSKEKMDLTTEDFGIDTSNMPVEKQDKTEQSLAILMNAAREIIRESKKGG